MRVIDVTINIAASWFVDIYSCKCGKEIQNKIIQNKTTYFKILISDLMSLALLLSQIIMQRAVNQMLHPLVFSHSQKLY